MEVVDHAINDAGPVILATVDATGNKKIINANDITDQKIIALLPGSRQQEISIKLPIMLEAAKQFPSYLFIVAQAPGQPLELYNTFIQEHNNAVVALSGQTYQLLKLAAAALVTSGTATLETALFGVPQVVCYKGSSISYQIAKRLVKIKYISLVNLIMDKAVVKELIQNELTVPNITKELTELLNNETKKEQVNRDYNELKKMLRSGGNASAKAAKEIIDYLLPTSGRSI
jgi:lipid-A-disaccharide synthase